MCFPPVVNLSLLCTYHLQEHPWVTKGGTDPLLSTEENCSDPVELPNSLELNHAFTRKMSHLICVVSSPLTRSSTTTR